MNAGVWWTSLASCLPLHLFTALQPSSAPDRRRAPRYCSTPPRVRSAAAMALAQLARLVVAGAAVPGAAAGAAGLPQAAAAARHLALRALQQQQVQQRRGFAVVSGEDSHADFKPQYKAEPVGDAAATIKGDISSHQVFIYMKGSPDAPQCGFSNMACRILDAYDFKYGSRNVLADAGIREGIKTFTGWPTIPQVFVKGEFIGGSDILMEMHKAGELSQLAEELQQQGGSGTGGSS